MKNIFQVLVCVFISYYGFGQKINSDVSDRFMDQEIVDCIIVMQDQLDLYGKTEGMKKEAKAEFVFSKLKSHAKKSQGDLSMYLTNENISFVDYYVFNGFQAYLSQQQAEYIIENFKVDQIVYNQPAQAAKPQKEEYTLDRSMAEWGILQINADSVWAMGFEGEGVVVGGQDTGYDFDNPLILSKYRGYTTEELDHDYNWHDAIDTINPLHGDTINDPSLNPCGFLSSEPCDDHGHGTHTMGTMVGNDSINDIGVAPAASWIGCRNMERGWGKPSTYTECFEWFLAPTDLEGQNPDPSKSPHVINNSWGCPTMEGCNIDNWMFMETVVNNLSAAGTVVVVSAGNSGGSGCGSVSNPAAIFDNSFTVGASNNSDGKAGFSSIGPVTVDSTFRIKPDVVAPGVGVRSIYLDEEFRTWNGTSMAGPHVAGAVALIINANPALAGEVDVIKDILKSTAIPLIDSTACLGNMALEVPNFYFGHGRIDALAAVRKAVDMISNVEDVEAAEKVIVYPNPNNGTMTIEVGQASSIKRIMMTDFTGKVVLSHSYIENRNSHLIDGLLPGMYIYTVQTEAGIHSGKVVVSK